MEVFLLSTLDLEYKEKKKKKARNTLTFSKKVMIIFLRIALYFTNILNEKKKEYSSLP